MILYTENNDKVKCTKANTPKFGGKNKYLWDCMKRKIDTKTTEFYFTVKNNRSYFYFCFDDEWYKTKMITDDGVDLAIYFEWSGNLHKNEKRGI